jgi:hypothetical protein
MPFRDFTQFDAATLQVMTAAYDAVVARLGIKKDDPLTGKLAAKIVELVIAGERELERLTDKALAALK